MRGIIGERDEKKWAKKRKVQESRGGGGEGREAALRGTPQGQEGRKEGCCEGKENSFPSNPQEDSVRCQKDVARH